MSFYTFYEYFLKNEKCSKYYTLVFNKMNNDDLQHYPKY